MGLRTWVMTGTGEKSGGSAIVTDDYQLYYFYFLFGVSFVPAFGIFLSFRVQNFWVVEDHCAWSMASVENGVVHSFAYISPIHICNSPVYFMNTHGAVLSTVF
jgi:hypothetical protein